MSPTRILDIATATPSYEYSQDESARLALSLLPDDVDRRAVSALERVYANSGIERRRSVLPDFAVEGSGRRLFPPSPDLRPEPSTAVRNTVYVDEAPRLAKRAVTSLLEGLGEEASGITHLVTASCTGFSAPGWDYDLLRDLGLPAHTARFHIGFMGCFAAFPALRLADHIVRSEPDARVLVVALELCSLHYAIDASRDALVANALFADGCAAALVAGEGAGGRSAARSDRPSLSLGPFASRIVAGSAGEMAWLIGETGFSMRLSPRVAASLGRSAGEIVDGLAAGAGLGRGDFRHWAIHPGGSAILDAFERALHLDPSALDPSRRVLREHGNMSSPTVLFVLERLLREGAPGPVFASAFGPGLTAESCLMELKS
ncbi:MAG TPA: type III polyketide synthase [Rectinemataceae bacterium]|nr:type III polyketide synthase [Rectinemataceae bacterium]